MSQEPRLYGNLRRKKSPGKSASDKKKLALARIKKEDFSPKSNFTLVCAYCGRTFHTNRANAKCCTRIHTNALYYREHPSKWLKQDAAKTP